MNQKLIKQQLLEQVTRAVKESGEAENFDPEAWLIAWLESPNPALGNARPRDLLHSDVGLQSVRQVLASIQSGAYR